MGWMEVLFGPSHNSDSFVPPGVIFPAGTYYPQVHPQPVKTDCNSLDDFEAHQHMSATREDLTGRYTLRGYLRDQGRVDA